MQPPRTPTVDKNAITQVRSELKLPLFALGQYMNARGWDMNLKMPDANGRHPGAISFAKRSPWHQRATLAMNCRYGYRFDGIDKDTIERTAQRSAELCLIAYETFPDLLPSTPNAYGVIRPDPIANKDEFRHVLHKEHVARHQDKAFTERHSATPAEQCFSFYHSFVRLSEADTPHIRSLIKQLNKKMSGHSAFEC
jgi:hypothetical protein